MYFKEIILAFIILCLPLPLLAESREESYSIYNVTNDVILKYNSKQKEVKYPKRGTPIELSDSLILRGNGSFVSVRNNLTYEVFKVTYQGNDTIAISISDVISTAKAKSYSNFVLLIKKICNDNGFNSEMMRESKLFIFKGENERVDDCDISFVETGCCNDIIIQKKEIKEDEAFFYSVKNNSADKDYFVVFYTVSPDNIVSSYDRIIVWSEEGLRNDKICFVFCPKNTETDLSYLTLSNDFPCTSYFFAIPSNEILTEDELKAFVYRKMIPHLSYKNNDVQVYRLTKKLGAKNN